MTKTNSMISFIEDVNKFDSTQDDIFLTKLETNDLKSKKVLLSALHEKMQFPYFGFNWDALNDVLSDLSWIKKKRIILLHVDSVTNLPLDDRKIYIEILLTVIKAWNDNPEIRPDQVIEIVFLKSDESVVEEIEEELKKRQ